MVGFPSVGKSCELNGLMGNANYNHDAIRVAVANHCRDCFQK